MRYRNAVFIHIPKTAGQSVREVLLNRGGTGEYHETVEEVLQTISYDTYKNLYSFCCIRNPWERMVSFYEWRIQHPKAFMPANVTFAAWLMSIPKSPDQFTAEHSKWYSDYRSVQSQLSWMTYNGEIAVTKIMRFENLKNDWAEVRNRLGIRSRLPIVNKSWHGKYQDYFNSELLEFMEARYGDDINQLGYSF